MIEGNTTFTIQKRHSFRLITTRKFYPCVHYLSVILNGIEVGKTEFKLVDPSLM